MTTAITQFDATGELSWNKTIEDFSGYQVTDKYGNIFALIQNLDDSSGSIYKYDKDGVFIDSVYLPFYPNDIHYGYDNCVCVCGLITSGSGSGSGSEDNDGYISKFNLDLANIASLTLLDYPVTQIRSDSHRNVYVSSYTGEIRKYIIHYNTFLKSWEVDFFSASGIAPLIVVSKSGNVYAFGLSEQGGWISTNDPSFFSYWGCKANCLNNVVPDMLCESGPGLAIAPNGTWASGFRPTKMRVHGTLFFGVSIIRIGLYAGTMFDRNRICDIDTLPELNVEYDLDWSLAPNIGSPIESLFVWTDGSTNTVCLSNVEFYSMVYSLGIASITSDGKVTGFLPRTNTIDALYLDKTGNILAQESSSKITLISPVTGTDIWSYDTEMQVGTIITGISGLLPTNSMVGLIEFSGDIEIGGNAQEATVVRTPVNKIQFYQPEPEIIGDMRIVYPSPGEIVFHSNKTGSDGSTGINIVEPINVASGILRLSSDPQPLSIINVSPARADFSANIELDGYCTILKPLGAIQFRIHPEYWELLAIAPKTGILILHEKPTMSFSSDYVTINQQTILVTAGEMLFSSPPPPDEITGDIEVDIPSFNLNMFSGDFINGIVDFEFPSFDIDMFGGNYLECALPTLSIEAEGYVGRYGLFQTTLPSLSIDMFSGSNIDIDLPSFLLSAEGSIGRNGTLQTTFPSFSFDLIPGGFVDVDLPFFSIEIEGNVGRLSQIQITLPSLSIELLSGNSLDVSLPYFDLDLQATRTTPAIVSIKFPSLGFSGYASPASKGVINLTFPRLQADFNLTIGIVGTLSSDLFALKMSGTSLTGITGDLEGFFRILKLKGTGAPSGPGDIEADFPLVKMIINSGEIESDILRYVMERVA